MMRDLVDVGLKLDSLKLQGPKKAWMKTMLFGN